MKQNQLSMSEKKQAVAKVDQFRKTMTMVEAIKKSGVRMDSYYSYRKQLAKEADPTIVTYQKSKTPLKAKAPKSQPSKLTVIIGSTDEVAALLRSM